jgi:hypothetical protein
MVSAHVLDKKLCCLAKREGPSHQKKYYQACWEGGYKMIQNQNGKIKGNRRKRTRKSETSINYHKGQG